MSIDQTDVVDFCSIDPAGREVELTIADHLDWTDEESHLRLLQSKVYRYLDFIDSGEIYARYPKARGLRLVIRVRAQSRPTLTALDLITKLAETSALEKVGLELQFPTDD